MILTNNKVLVLPDAHFTSDGEFELFDDFEPAKHWSVRGTVLQSSLKFLCYHDEVQELRKRRDPIVNQRISELVSRSLEFSPVSPIETGDEVYFRYISHQTYLEAGEFLEVGNSRALFIDYDMIYMRKKMQADEPEMLNGWILIEPIDFSTDDLVRLGGGFMYDGIGDSKPGIGVVKKTGRKNDAYIDGSVEGPDVEIGQRVLFRHSNAVSFEFAFHSLFKSNKPWYRMQRKDILCVM